MKIDTKKINKELRFIANIYKQFLPSDNEKMLKLQYKFRWVLRRKTRGLRCDEEWIQRKDGTKLRLRIYRPLKPTGNGPAILWLHGGGYALGVPEMCGKISKAMLKISNGVVVAPDYTLSAEKPYPAALEDSYLALLWMKEHALELGGKPNQIMIGGESAGGGLAIATTLLARDKKEVNISFQMPIYPMIDDQMLTPSMMNNDAPIWNVVKNEAAWKLYLGELYQSEEISPYAAPARELDYTNLPPAVTYVGDLDPFLDETITYIKNLKSVGIPVKCTVYKGCYHGFDTVCPRARVSKRAVESFLKAYAYAAKNFEY